MTSFNPYTDSLEITFTCPNCSKTSTYQIDDVPCPEWMGEFNGANSDEFLVNCSHCSRRFWFDVFVDKDQGNIIVTDDETLEEVEDITLNEINYE